MSSAAQLPVAALHFFNVVFGAFDCLLFRCCRWAAASAVGGDVLADVTGACFNVVVFFAVLQELFDGLSHLWAESHFGL